MIRHDTTTRLGVESLEARDCPSGLTSFSWGEWSWGESGWDVRTAQTNPSNGEPSSIPVEQVSTARG